MEEYQYSITKEEINECRLAAFEGTIQVVEDYETAKTVIKSLQQEKEVGFDTESRPSFNKGEHHPISLIQLSTENRAFLFRINMIKPLPDFTPLFANENVIKIGLGIKDELVELEKVLGLQCVSFADLEKIAACHKFHQRGVRALAAFFLGIRISKSAQKSNWERSTLTEQQQRYAATDAWVCLRIYRQMIQNNFLPLPKRDDIFVQTKCENNEK